MVFTWNVGHASPEPSELDAWLPLRGAGLDLLVVSTQENAYKARDIAAKRDAAAASSRPSGRATSDPFDYDYHSDPEDDPMLTSAEPSGEEKPPRRFRSLLPGPARGVGKADWTTRLCFGKNLCGRVEKIEDWEHLVLARLNAGVDDADQQRWRIVKHAVLAEMRLTVYERVRLEEEEGLPPRRNSSLRRSSSLLSMVSLRQIPLGVVSLARRDRVALGALGVAANKGGLAIELRISLGSWQTSVLLVGAHLAAHDHKINTRNKQTVHILEHLYHRAKIGTARDSVRSYEKKLDLLSQFDHIIW